MPVQAGAGRLTEQLEEWDPERPSPETAAAVLKTARELLAGGSGAHVLDAEWHVYLDLTRLPAFLRALPDREARSAWADTTFEAVALSRYDLQTMPSQRVAAHPDRVLFREYRVREPIAPGEIGRLLRLFLGLGLPIRVAPGQLYCVVLNREDQIVAGICYRQPSPGVAHLDGIVRAPSLKSRGLSSRLLEDFCSRMSTRGVEVVSTHFVSREFFGEHGFRVDRRWGGLVRFLKDRPL